MFHRFLHVSRLYPLFFSLPLSSGTGKYVTYVMWGLDRRKLIFLLPPTTMRRHSIIIMIWGSYRTLGKMGDDIGGW